MRQNQTINVIIETRFKTKKNYQTDKKSPIFFITINSVQIVNDKFKKLQLSFLKHK